MAYKYKGRDRRLMTQCARDLARILSRDQRTFNPKKTNILSTRTLILAGATNGGAPAYTPGTPTPGSLAAFAEAVRSGLVAELSLTV